MDAKSSAISTVADIASSPPIKNIRSDNTLQDSDMHSARTVGVGLTVNKHSQQKKKIARRRSMRNISRKEQNLNDALLVDEVISELKEESVSSKLTESEEKYELNTNHRDVYEQPSTDVESIALLKVRSDILLERNKITELEWL